MNPEFQRYVWLELTTLRLVTLIAVLMSLYILCVTTGLSNAQANVFQVVFGFFVLFMGPMKVSQSVNEEVSQRTWDWKRMSSTSASSVVLGKLFGATIYSWIGAGFAAALVLVACRTQAEFDLHILRIVFTGSLAIFLQIATLLAAIDGIPDSYDNAGSARRSNISWLVGVLVCYGFIQSILMSPKPLITEWYGSAYKATSFVIVSLFVFSAWGFAGALGAMRRQLAFRDWPICFAAFHVFLAFYLTGFDFDARTDFAQSLVYSFSLRLFSILGVISLISFYCTLLLDKMTISTFNRITAAAKNRTYAILFFLLPRWLTSFVLGAIAATFVVLQGPSDVGIAILSIFALAFRDIGIFFAFRVFKRGTRDWSFLAALIVVVAVLPTISVKTGYPLFIPSSSLISFVSLSMQALITLGLAVVRYKTLAK